jgi:hypothetical protein
MPALAASMTSDSGASEEALTLGTDVPEALTLARVGVVPTIARSRSGTRPRHRSRGGHKADSGSRNDRTARTPLD